MSDFVRQSKFNDDMSLTNIPAKNTEQSQLEQQGSLDQYLIDQRNLDRIKIDEFRHES